MTDVGTAARLRAAFELSPTILAVSDPETGQLLEVNEAFLRITGWTREEIIGRPIFEVGFWEVLRAGGTVRDLEARFRTKDGGEAVAIANADLVVVDGRTCVITALMDITARKQLERAKDELLAMLGHELRNRVGDEELKRLAAAIGHQTSQLSRLVEAPPASTSVGRRRVLIVEDNVDARESLQLLLQLAGHEVETAPDGPSGLRKLEAFRPDVAVIDLGLPGIDGYDLVRRARGLPQTQATRFIALTGYGQAEDRRRALDAGFDVHLTKPVDPERLQRLLAAG
jgi:PAS domain S-box-containing protein